MGAPPTLSVKTLRISIFEMGSFDADYVVRFIIMCLLQVFKAKMGMKPEYDWARSQILAHVDAL